MEQSSLDDQALRDEVYADVIKLCKENKLNSLETPKQFQLLKDPFTIESDLLTPTMKRPRGGVEFSCHPFLPGAPSSLDRRHHLQSRRHRTKHACILAQRLREVVCTMEGRSSISQGVRRGVILVDFLSVESL